MSKTRLMMTREEVVEILMYCKEYKVSYKYRLAELNISVWRFLSHWRKAVHLFLFRRLPVRVAVTPREPSFEFESIEIRTIVSI